MLTNVDMVDGVNVADVTVATASGSVYVYKEVGASVWSQTQILQPTVPVADGFFGFSVSSYGDMLVVGAKGQTQSQGERRADSRVEY